MDAQGLDVVRSVCVASVSACLRHGRKSIHEPGPPNAFWKMQTRACPYLDRGGTVPEALFSASEHCEWRPIDAALGAVAGAGGWKHVRQLAQSHVSAFREFKTKTSRRTLPPVKCTATAGFRTRGCSSIVLSRCPKPTTPAFVNELLGDDIPPHFLMSMESPSKRFRLRDIISRWAFNRFFAVERTRRIAGFAVASRSSAKKYKHSCHVSLPQHRATQKRFLADVTADLRGRIVQEIRRNMPKVYEGALVCAKPEGWKQYHWACCSFIRTRAM